MIPNTTIIIIIAIQGERDVDGSGDPLADFPCIILLPWLRPFHRLWRGWSDPW